MLLFPLEGKTVLGVNLGQPMSQQSGLLCSVGLEKLTVHESYCEIALGLCQKWHRCLTLRDHLRRKKIVLIWVLLMLKL